MQRNTSIAARALVRITCRHVGAGVDTARYLFAERRKKKRRAARERWKDVVKESAESSRCWPPPPFLQPPPFPAFLSVRACVSLSLSPCFLYQAPSRISLSPTFRLSSVTRRKRRLSRRLSRGEEYTLRASNIRKAIFSSTSSQRICTIFLFLFLWTS